MGRVQTNEHMDLRTVEYCADYVSSKIGLLQRVQLARDPWSVGVIGPGGRHSPDVNSGRRSSGGKRIEITGRTWELWKQ